MNEIKIKKTSKLDGEITYISIDKAVEDLMCFYFGDVKEMFLDSGKLQTMFAYYEVEEGVNLGK